MEQLNKNIKQSIYWNYISSVIIHGIALLTTAILLKLLTPEDFGILAELFLVLGVGSIFIGQGYIYAIIKEKNIDNKVLSTVFWINVSIGVLVVILSFLLGDTIGAYFEVDRFRDYIFLFSFAYLLQAINVVPLALLERNLDYKGYSIIHIYATIVAAFVTLMLALYGFGVYSLIWRGLVSGLVVTIMVWYKSRWRPDFIFRYDSLAHMHKFSRSVFGTQVVRYGANQLDNLLVAKLLGTNDLGLYNRAKTFVTIPIREIHAKTRSVAYSALSKIENPVQYGDTLFRFILLLSVVILPLLLIILISSETLVYSFLSEEWYPMINLLKLLALASIIISTSMPGQILLSKSESGTLFRTEVVGNIIKVVLLLFAFKYTDLTTIVALFLLGQLISNLLQNIVAYSKVEGSKYMIWKYHLLPVVMTFLAYGIAVLIDHFMDLSLFSMVLKLVVCFFVFGMFYWKTYPDILAKIKENI